SGIYAGVFQNRWAMGMDCGNGKLVCKAWAGRARPVDDSQDLSAVLLCKARNMKAFGVPPGSDKADADLFLGHGWLTLQLAMHTRRLSTATWGESTKLASLTRARVAPAGPAPRRSHRRAARSSERRRRLLPTPPS